MLFSGRRGIKQCEALPRVAETGESRPLQNKSQAKPTTKIKDISLSCQRTYLIHDAPSRRRRPSLLRKSVNSPVSATPTEFASQIGQSPRLGDADRVCFANRSIPPSWRRRPSLLRKSVNPPSSHIPKTALNFYAKSRSANLF